MPRIGTSAAIRQQAGRRTGTVNDDSFRVQRTPERSEYAGLRGKATHQEGPFYMKKPQNMRRLQSLSFAGRFGLMAALLAGSAHLAPAQTGTLTPAQQNAKAKAQNVPEIPYDSVPNFLK